MNETMKAYIEYFKEKDYSNCEITKEFIKDYQQKINSKYGYGYINFAHHLATNGNTSIKLDDDTKKYMNYLVNLSDKEIVELQNFFTLTNVKDVEVNARNGEPNQKWHLFISYFLRNAFLGKRAPVHSILCPELWLWMFESSGILDTNELKEVYDRAVEYKKSTKKNRIQIWKNSIKDYRKRLDKEVVYKFNAK